jgi:hypothetical protein
MGHTFECGRGRASLPVSAFTLGGGTRYPILTTAPAGTMPACASLRADRDDLRYVVLPLDIQT